MQAGVSELDGDSFDWGDRSAYHPPTYWGI
jgi:hypothetical protein